MKISINKPEFENSFLVSYKKATARGCSTFIDKKDNDIYIEVKSNDRVIGKFSFVIDGDECISSKKFIIEREYYPFELAIFDLVKFLKRKKVKFVIWE